MVPNASDLARRRLTVVGVLRVLAVVAWLVTCFPVVLILAIVAVEGPSGGEPLIAALVIGASGGAIGAALWALAPWLSARILPTPRAHACPRCGYDLRAITEPRCPECGTVLTEEFLPGHVAPGPSLTPTAGVARAQLTTALVGRAVAVPAGFGFLAGALTAFGSTATAPNWWDTDDYFMSFLWLGFCLFGLAACAVPLLFPRRFARAFVPARLAADPPAPQPPPPTRHTSNAPFDQTATPSPAPSQPDSTTT